MRVVGGSLKRRKLSSLQGWKIRPTTDYLREALFNILGSIVEGAVVLDLYAGTGSLGIEALSRGALSCVFVDNDRQAIRVILRNIALCGLEDRCTVLRRNVMHGLGFLRGTTPPVDLVFMDPPYDKGFIEPTLEMLDQSGYLAPGGCVVAEHSSKEEAPKRLGGLRERSKRHHGKAAMSFYEYVL